MSRLAAAFTQRRAAALIAYLTVGYPDLEASLEAVPLLVDNGADIVELGIPFSDPLADGVTIQQASFAALKNGVTPARCLEMARTLRARLEVPLVFLSYFNPIWRFGPARFCAQAAGAGVDGLIIPDLPPDEGGELEATAARHGLDLIYLLAPTSTEGRIREVARRSRGFIYLVSVTGVTGPRQSLPPDLPAFVARVRRAATQPLCVGFGIATPEQAAAVARLADGVIVGSRLVQIMGSGPGWQAALAACVRQLREAIDASSSAPAG